MNKTEHHEPILVGEPQMIQRQLTPQEAIQFCLNSIQQMNTGMQHFHERLTMLEKAAHTHLAQDESPEILPE